MAYVSLSVNKRLLKRGKVIQAVVVVLGVVGLRRVDDEQAGSPDELFGHGEERSGSSSRFWGCWPQKSQ